MNTLIHKKNHKNDFANVWRTKILNELDYELKFGTGEDE